MIRALLALVLVSALPGRALAGPCDAEAKAAVKAGRDARLVGPKGTDAGARMDEGNARYAEALKRSRVVATQDTAAPEFLAAIDAYVAAEMLEPSPLGLYNLAQTYRAMGDYTKAIAQYRKFLETVKPGRPLRRLVDCHITSMSAELDRAASKAPPTGPESTSPGNPTEPTGTSATPMTTATPTVATTTTTQPLDLQLDTAPGREPWQADTLGWTIGGTGLAIAAVGGYLLLDARSMRAEAEDEPREDVRIDLRERADGRQTWGTITTITGGALLVGGIVKLALHPDAPRRPTSGASLTITPGGLAIGGRF